MALNLDEKISIKNLCNWTVGFKKIETVGDCSIPPKTSIRMSRGEVISQVESGNSLFVGKDGNGSHASIYIMDESTRVELGFEEIEKVTEEVTDETTGKVKKKAVSKVTKKQMILDDTKIKEIFAIESMKDFEIAVTDNVKTFAEKQLIADAVTKFKLNDYNKVTYIKNYTGCKID